MLLLCLELLEQKLYLTLWRLSHAIMWLHLTCLLLSFILRYFPKINFNIIFPSFLSIPALVVGIPVCRAILCFVWLIPKALFHENDNPGIPVFDFLLAIFKTFYTIFYK